MIQIQWSQLGSHWVRHDTFTLHIFTHFALLRFVRRYTVCCEWSRSFAVDLNVLLDVSHQLSNFRIFSYWARGNTFKFWDFTNETSNRVRVAIQFVNIKEALWSRTAFSTRSKPLVRGAFSLSHIIMRYGGNGEYRQADFSRIILPHPKEMWSVQTLLRIRQFSVAQRFALFPFSRRRVLPSVTFQINFCN